MFGVWCSEFGGRLLVEAVGMRGRQLVTGGEVTGWSGGNEGRQLVTGGEVTS